jgi:uncharacterized protein (TIGR03435 family)
MHALRATVLVASLSGIVLGQANTKLEFEVATIKPAAAARPTAPSGPGTSDPENIRYNYVSVKNLLLRAYGLPMQQIAGPAWIDSDRYDVAAKVPPGTTKDQANVMLQNLLADRFKLAVHRETRELSRYELTVGKNGSKLTPYVEDAHEPEREPGKAVFGKDGFPVPRPGGFAFTMGPGSRKLAGRKNSIAQLAQFFSTDLERPVVDKTGLTGEYDYVLKYMPDSAAQSDTPSDAPSLVVAVQEQLGLKLESKKGPVEMLIVDSGQRTPTEN